MQKILFVINRFGGGGAEAQARRIALALSEKGYEVATVSLWKDVYNFDDLDQSGVRRIQLDGPPGKLALLLLPKLVTVLKDTQPDVAVGMMIPADPLLRVAGYLAGVPVISSLRNEYVGGAAVNLFLRITDGFVARLTTNSSAAKKKLGPKVSKRPVDIEIIPNALDVSKYSAAATVGSRLRTELGVGENDFLWLSVGAQRPQKNYSALIEAFATLPSGRLLIAGSNLQQTLLLQVSQKHGVSERVSLLGRRADVPQLLSAADGYVMSSLHEGLPNAVMEAMAAGKPVVATDVGGVSDLVLNDSFGLLVQPGSARALAIAMKKVTEMSDYDRRAMGERAREHILTNYNTDSIIQTWERVLREVIGGL